MLLGLNEVLVSSMGNATIEVLNMIGTWVAGIGTIAAVWYAMLVNTPKVKAAITVRRENSSGNLILDVFNSKHTNAHIAQIALVKKRFRLFPIANSAAPHCESVLVKPEAGKHRLDITVTPGGYEKFEITGVQILSAYQSLYNMSTPNYAKRMVKAQISITINDGIVTYVDLPKSQYQKMKNLLLLPSQRTMQELEALGPERMFPKDYDKDHRQKLVERYNKEYQLALDRHEKIKLPRGIRHEHFLKEA